MVASPSQDKTELSQRTSKPIWTTIEAINARDAKQRASAPTKPRKRTFGYLETSKLVDAVKCWNDHKGDAKPPTKASVALRYGFNPSMFTNYATDNASKRMKVGTKPGRQSVVSESNAMHLAQMAMAAHGEKNSMTVAEFISHAKKLEAGGPDSKMLTPKQLENWTRRYFMNQYKGVLKVRKYKNRKRSGVGVALEKSEL
jgi:hypothetical protein